MKEKGFTLIELLAVIVILAIIALIATPIVLDIINDTKTNASLRSGEFYIDAAEQAIAMEMINDATFKAKECRIKEDGNLLCSELGFNVCEERNTEIVCSGKEKEVKVEVSGEKPTEGIIKLDAGKVEDVKLVLSNNSLVMKENNLVFENDTEVIYEVDIVKGSKIDMPDIFDYNTIYIVTFTNEALGINEKQRAILSEENGVEFLAPENEIGGLTQIPLYYESTPYEGHFKIEKTNQKLDNYSLTALSTGLLLSSNEFELASSKSYLILDDIISEPSSKIVEKKFGEFVYISFLDYSGSIYNAVKNGVFVAIRIEQEIDGKKIIRQYGGVSPKYQETYINSAFNNSYYWGLGFFPVYLLGT